MPRYLLSPDVALLLDADRDQRKRLLIEAFWNTGGRLNEVLLLTLKDFTLDGQDGRALDAPFVVLHTLKERRDGDRQKQRGRCRPTKEEQAALREAEAIPPRAVPLTDPGYVRRLREHFATVRLKR
ncbi:hypothetical protein [Pantoea sp. AS142]|uniref:hypothetical protein n=1 Tax=Pantoea sp. AS142 TaxID=3081292 RepID=UPI00301747D7